MNGFSFGNAARAHLDRYLVPDGATREVFLQIGEALDRENLEAFDLIVMQNTWRVMRDEIGSVYRPRSPLEAQLEYDRARKDAAMSGLGVWPEWVAGDDPIILDRWERWRNGQ